MATQGAQRSAQRLAFAFGRFGRRSATAELVVRLTSGAHPTLNVLAELASVSIKGFALEQGQLLFQLFGLGLDMRQAGLPVLGMDPVIGGVGVGDEGPVEALAKDSLGRLGRTVLVQVEESQIRISGIPRPVRVAIVAPGGLVSVRDRESADFLAQILVEGQSASHGLARESISAAGAAL